MLKSLAWPALGTAAAVWLTEPDSLQDARSILEEEIAAIDQACSRFRPDSELSRLNQADGNAIAASDLFLEAVEVALQAARLTRGAGNRHELRRWPYPDRLLALSKAPGRLCVKCKDSIRYALYA